ncbi:MAG: hypothetical protein IPH37_01475 [Burkholderiales bacterium]|nr:hypothetical protein [Burkholderiales bacterium]MBK9348275.1 hypothetical protein [Burkholderiales bacterium]MBP8053428.1 hypothetical protein [Burkholderiaceae bacterium]
MAFWTTFAHARDYPFDARRTAAQWAQLHAGDQEPLPQDERLLAAWALYHSGAFQEAAEAGLAIGPAGLAVANKATCIYANYLESKERTRLSLFLTVAERAAAQAAVLPDDASAQYWQAYALGRYSQGISVAKALAQGVGERVKLALEQAIRLRPLHAEAHICLGAFHAEVIDKVGPLIGNMTYGARKDVSLALFQRSLSLTPQSAIAQMEYANALVMLEGDDGMAQATQLYEQAANSQARDAMEHLDRELAQTMLGN